MAGGKEVCPTNSMDCGVNCKVIAVVVASNSVDVFEVVAGVNSAIVVVPRVMVISHDVMSEPGRWKPVAPFVVIVPDIV